MGRSIAPGFTQRMAWFSPKPSSIGADTNSTVLEDEGIGHNTFAWFLRREHQGVCGGHLYLHDEPQWQFYIGTRHIEDACSTISG